MNGAMKRKERLIRTAAWLLASIIVLILIATILLQIRVAQTPAAARLPDGLKLPDFLANLLWILPYLIVGLSITNRLPRHRYGWVLLLFSMDAAGLYSTMTYGTIGLVAAPGSLPYAEIAFTLVAFEWFFVFAAIVFLILLFPNGNLFSKGWAVVGWIAIITSVVTSFFGIFQPGKSGFIPVENPYGNSGLLSRIADIIIQPGVVVLWICIPLALISLIARFRRAGWADRQQMKWFLFGASCFILFLAIDEPTQLPGVWESLKEGLFIAIMPVAIGIAILRYRLYDIDIIIRRTLVYSLLTAILVAVYFGSVVVFQRLSDLVVGNESPAAVVISTLVIAALFTPLRKRTQAGIDRRFYRQSYDAEKALASFSASQRSEVDLDQIANQLLAVLQETMQPESISLWLRGGDRGGRINRPDAWD